MKYIKLFETFESSTEYTDMMDLYGLSPNTFRYADPSKKDGVEISKSEPRPPKEIEDILQLNPFKKLIAKIVSLLNSEEEEELKKALASKGIDAQSSPEEVHNVVSNVAESLQSLIVSEGEEGKDELIKDKVAEILHSIGAGNIAAWGGVPAAIAVGSLTDMPLGFAISWGATAVLMGLAKALDKDEKYLSEEMLPGGESETGEGEVIIDEEEE